MRILFVPFGSEGDVNPLVWMADCLAKRGHEPVFLITPHYARRVAGFEWHPIGTEEDFQRLARNPMLWHPRWGTFTVARAMHESLSVYRHAFHTAGGRFDRVVTSSFGFGAGCVAEARGIPWIMTHLQPICFRSLNDAPIFGKNLEWTQSLPRPLKSLLFLFMDVVCAVAILPPLNRFRRRLRLSPWRRFYRDALMGGDTVLGLFPEWFAAPQDDWPAKARLVGFPTVRPTGADLPAPLARWIAAGPAPVLWTHGSANLHTEEFLAHAVKAARATGTRALLVSRTPPSVGMGEDVLHVDHVPFEDVFPRCAAVVHHGGIGTTAKAFAAGIPQVVVPLAHDQFDNALRVERLGCGRFSSLGRVTSDLASVLNSSAIRGSVSACVERMREDPASKLCDMVEGVTRRGSRV